MLRQLKAIEQTTGFVKAVRLQPEWISELRNRSNVVEALASLQIEGNSLTLEEAFALAHHRPDRELRNAEREFYNYLNAFEAVDGLRNDRDAVIGRGDLCNLQRLLVDGVRGGRRGAGSYRREDVKVGDVQGTEIVVHHHPPGWLQVDPEMRALLDWIEFTKIRGDGPEDPWIHPVIQAGIAQHRFVWIHPFLDGNGRSARMMTTMLLYQRGYDFKYLFELSTYYNNDRDQYYEALRTADVTGDYTEWLTYFLGGFAYQMIRIQDAARARAESESRAGAMPRQPPSR
jgi:Fic family protein